MRTIKRIFITIMVGLTLTVIGLSCNYWINTQPVWVSKSKTVDKDLLLKTPEKNVQIVNFIETHGQELAPNYEGAVCTEFVIKVINQFDNLSLNEKNTIRIITSKKLDSLILTDSPVIKGVQTALTKGKKGVEIDKIENVRPGDFVQFWNLYKDKEYGHCGIVLEIKPNESITVYSSHPVTNGYGKQKFLWPDKIYFARLE
jgi:hypothetical protein